MIRWVNLSNRTVIGNWNFCALIRLFEDTKLKNPRFLLCNCFFTTAEKIPMVLPSGQTGVNQVNIINSYYSSCASSEKKRGSEGPKLIWGIRWSCSVCTGGVVESVDLCTPCYMNDRACTDHQFWRIDSPEKAGERRILKYSNPGARWVKNPWRANQWPVVGKRYSL